MSIMMILLGMAFIGVGAVYLIAPNFMWELDRIFDEAMGLHVTRTERWYALQRIVASIAIVVGIAIIALEVTTPTATANTYERFLEAQMTSPTKEQ